MPFQYVDLIHFRYIFLLLNWSMAHWAGWVSQRLSLNPTMSFPLASVSLTFPARSSSCKTTSSSVCLVCKQRARSLLAIELPCSVSIQKNTILVISRQGSSTCSESYGYLYPTAISWNSQIFFAHTVGRSRDSCVVSFFGCYLHPTSIFQKVYHACYPTNGIVN